MSSANVDYETKSGAEIRLGLPVYFADPEADVLTFSYRLPDSDILRWRPGQPNPESLFEHVRNGGRIRGFNVMFEWMTWNLICTPKYGWPPLPLEQLVDTMAECHAMNLPGSLEKAGEAVGLPVEKLKSKRGKRLIQLLCRPQKTTKNQTHAWLTRQTHPALHDELADYCDQDIVAEESLARKLRPLSEFEQKVWVVTQQINLKGVPIAIDEVENITRIVREETDRLNLELRELTGRPVDGVAMRPVPKASNRAAMLRWFQQHPRLSGIDAVCFEEDAEDDGEPDPFLLDMQGATVDTALRRADIPDDVRRVLEIRRQVVQTSTAKFPKLLKITASDSTLKFSLLYHGAGTGRWASRAGFNTQNLARPTMSKTDIAAAHDLLGFRDHEICSMMFGNDLMRAAVCCLRGVIKAEPGHEFIDADLSSIENRIAAWLACQDDKLAMFAESLDEYRVFASKQLFHCAYADVTPDQRQKTKPVILGGIFGLGAEGLVVYAKQYGVEMTLEESRVNIKALRSEYDKVVALWYACGDAALEAVRSPGTWIAAGEKLALIVYRKALWLKLPSGRLISWSRPRIENLMVPWKEKKVIGYDVLDNPVVEKIDVYKDVVTVESIDTFTRQFTRHKLIGSSIFQSAVQGCARDVLAVGLNNVVEAGWDPRMLIHDEILCQEVEGLRDPEELCRLMCHAVPWMDGLPLAAEGWAGKRFRK